MKLLKNLLFACAASAFLFVNAAQAQVMWIDYSWKVEPQNEKKFIAAVEKFTRAKLSALFPEKCGLLHIQQTDRTQQPTLSQSSTRKRKILKRLFEISRIQMNSIVFERR